jgi:CelD/BcsL family acetyltransferase involved in cellulose biosynthesis
MIEVHEFDDLAAPELVRAWDALEDAGACPGLFSSRAWVTSWAASFADGLEPAALVGLDGGREPVGLAPLFVGAEGAVFPVNFLSPRGELLVRRGAEREFGAAVLARLRKRRLRLTDASVPRDSPTYRALAGPGAAGYLRLETPGRVSPFVDVAGPWDEYTASRPRRVTHQWERKIRKAEREARLTFHRAEPVQDLDALVERLVTVDARSWREKEGTSIGGRGVRGFYADATAALAASGRLRLFWLETDGRTVAFLYGAVFDGVYYALKTAFDEEFSRLSPGAMLFHGAVRDAFETGLRRFDFVGETARWKEEWATGCREHASVALRPAGVAGLLTQARDAWLKPLARRVLRPSSAGGEGKGR